MRFEAEEVQAVALGNGWVAAATSLNFLRIFTDGGLQVCNPWEFLFSVLFNLKLPTITQAYDNWKQNWTALEGNYG